MSMQTRRDALLLAGAVAAAAPATARADGDADISATEDLMREHGVLRRVLVIYRESAGRLRAGARLDVAALAQGADLFRRFGEDYHERKLEEQHVFPAVRKAGGPAAALVDTLVRQHDCGREINLFVIDRCKGGRLGSADAAPLAQAMESFSRMYEKHAAMEDTVVFQTWRKSLSRPQLAETSELFERIERQQFKGDDFDLGVAEVARIEQRLGIADLAAYTAPPFRTLGGFATRSPLK
jgi:hemerythrin-like domain-containing protein